MTAPARSAVETMRVKFGDRAQDESQNPDSILIEEYRRLLLNPLNVIAVASNDSKNSVARQLGRP